MELREVLFKTGELTMEELAAVTAENVEQYLRRLKDRDARFDYEVIFSGDLGPAKQGATGPPGLMASVSDGKKTINMFARDAEALRLSPPKGSFSFKKEAAPKLEEFRRTGRPQEFGPDELVNFTFELPLMPAPDKETRNQSLLIKRSPSQRFLLRVTFGAGGAAVVYDLMEDWYSLDSGILK